MRLVLTAAVLAALTAACATPRKPTRTVVVHRAPDVVVYDESATQPPMTTGETTTTTTGPYAPAYDPNQKNPVPGSVREYINRYPSGGAMAK